MTIAVLLIVLLGVGGALLMAPAADGYAAFLFACIVGLGLLSVALVRRMKRGVVSPGRCSECGGLISTLSPYCKHCGALRDRPD